jgi:hypothetical protein
VSELDKLHMHTRHYRYVFHIDKEVSIPSINTPGASF